MIESIDEKNFWQEARIAMQVQENLNKGKKVVDRHEALMRQASLQTQQLADEQHLGEFVEMLHSAKKARFSPIVVTVIFSCFMLAVGILVLKPITAAINSIIPWLFFPLFFVYFMVKMYISEKRSQKIRGTNHVVIYTEGFIACERLRLNAYRWDAIVALWRGQASPGKKRISDIDVLHFQTLDKKTFRVLPYQEVHFRAGLCDAIERGFLDTHLSAMLTQYAAGTELAFGDFYISDQGVRDGVETLPWERIEQFQVTIESVTIRKEGRTSNWFFRLTPDLPNACLLRELLASLPETQR